MNYQRKSSSTQKYNSQLNIICTSTFLTQSAEYGNIISPNFRVWPVQAFSNPCDAL